ncbi:hypothetical protein ABB37_04134 [Leptomonas pyrrhocoris]|uniref:SET domain-containing protein n=1 Tax=Leptomonas pyrrhocoris TaxID=157538 RepID=A0A0M9G4E4_LEPPY|nr:hypothetical protein ABB37_04134 [Leptomonas pyrrhocoris]KPA81886.1 hypothetical protein ABB37_04134 [Leptomonas pyrrhocoris]|eukprot:XP_015660325.1 hypothetical protein ABB37_04134 [Leptomonas pyrrhocoris]
MTENAQRGGPSWTYTQDFYTMALAGTCLKVFTDEMKGKGLCATRAIAADDVVHEETALCCSQNMDDYNIGVQVCAFCLKSLETPRTQVARNAHCRKAALALPHHQLHMPESAVPCLWRETGCTDLFCSARCREAATQKFHWVSCAGRLTAEQQAARREFLQYDWVQNGVDFSDTAMVGFRIVAQVLCAHRLHGCSMSEGFAPYAQLIRSPLASFYFSYLLLDNVPTAASSTAEVAAHAAAVKASKSDPMAIPEVRAAYTVEGRSKAAMCKEGVALLQRLFDMSDEERSYLNASRWSELLGAVLLNGQDRSPPSPYDLHRDLVACLPDGEALMKEFEHNVLQTSSLTDAADLSHSSRGQGIYGVGCLFNHSCDPNLNVQYAAVNDETLSVVALRDIAAGEELTISYIDTSLPYAVRQQQLLDHYLFECKCPRCRCESSENKLFT